MMIFERMQTDNDFSRPETSKLSRSSNRAAIFNTTTKDFNTKQLNTTQRANETKATFKNDSQATFFQNKPKQAKTSHMSATFFEQPKSTKTKPAPQKKPDEQSLGKSSNSHTNEPAINPQEQMTSSKGFFINTDDLKNGVTLDKVLGGNFKKIDVFGTTCKEFETPEFFPSHVIDEKINELSEPEDGYPDASFEIVETENEEDVNNQSPGKKHNLKNPKSEDRLNDSFDVKNKDICDKITKKYKHKSTKANGRMRANTRSPECFNSSTQPDTQENEEVEAVIERQSRVPKKLSGKENYDKEIRNLIVGNLREVNFNKTAIRSNKNNESKSLSPKIPGTRQSRFQMTFLADPKETTKEGFRQNPQLSATRQTFNKDGKNEGGNPFRISNNFKNKGNQEEVDYEREDNAYATSKKQGFIQAYGMDNEREKNCKTQTGFGVEPANKLKSTGTKFFSEKSNLKNYEVKNPIEQNRIADRIQQHEKEMLEKYSNRKAVEPTERRNMRQEEKNIMREGSNRRLSTPMRDGGQMNATFQRKKYYVRN